MIKSDVGMHAGDVYTLLSQRGRLTIRNIGELTQKRESHIFLSIGWLLRENKIFVSESNGEWFFEINAAISDIYY